MQTLTTETPDTENGRGALLAAEMCTAAELVHRYGAEIRLTALRLTRSEVAAQDIVQEVFLRLIRSGGFDPSRGPLHSWVHTVTRNTAVDWIRHEAASQQRVIRVGAIHSASAVVVEEVVTERAQANDVRAAVALLPISEREVVSLAYFDGLTYRQIAQLLRLPEGTVKSRIRRALTRMSCVLVREAGEP